jgi:hypothetical protein
MPNTSRISGARPVKHLNGGPWNGQVNIYEVPVGETVAIFKGDFVKASDSAGTDVFPVCEAYGTGTEVTSGLILGVCMGFVIDPTNLNTPQYRLASTKRYIYVADAPDLIFQIQDGATVTTPKASVGLNCGVNTTAGSTTTGLSNYTTGATAATTTNTLPLKIVGIVNAPDNEAAAQYQQLLVLINQHYYMGGQTAV